MKPPVVILSIVLAALQFAVADDFKTVGGKEYKNVEVSRVEPDGIVLKTKSGISKLYFTELPKAVQERFGYKTPVAAPAGGSSATPVPHAAASAAFGKWAYSEYHDEMGRGTTKEAHVTSSNAVHFGFPYEGETHAALKLLKGPKGRTSSSGWNAGSSFPLPVGITSRSGLTTVSCESSRLSSRLRAQAVFCS